MWTPLPVRQLHLRTHLSNCACRCSFCCLGNYTRNDISFDRYERLVLSLMEHCSEKGIRLRSYVYNSLEYSDLARHVDLLRKIGAPRDIWGYFDINGTRVRTGDELSRWIDHLIDAGMHSAGFSWFGLRDDHDGFVNHPGYFDYLCEAAEALRSAGIPIKGKVYLTPAALDDALSLLKHAESLSDYVQLGMVEYTGDAKTKPELFISPGQFAELPELVRRKYGKEFPSTFRTEAEWIRLAGMGMFPSFNQIDYVMYVDGSNIDQWELMSPQEIMDWFEGLDRRVRGSFESVSSLALAYGDPQGDLLMECRDVIRKWLDAHFDALGMDHDDLFSLTSSSVEWKVAERLYTNG